MAPRSIVAMLVLLFSLFSGFSHAETDITAPININQADATVLASLEGVGESKAQAIVAYRDANGPFLSINDLGNVKGIGEKTLEKNAERLTIE